MDWNLYELITFLVDQVDFANIYNGLIGNGCSGVVAKLAGAVVAHVATAKKPNDHTAKLVAAVQKRVELSVPASCNPQRIRNFLHEREVMVMIQQIYVVLLMHPNAETDFIKHPFTVHLAACLKEPEKAVAGLAETFFDSFVAACRAELAIRQVVRTEDIESSARDSSTYSLLMKLQTKLDALMMRHLPHHLDEQAINQFEEAYRQWLAERDWDFLPILSNANLEAYDRVPIDRLYVEPQFAESPRRKESVTIGLREFMKGIHRTVLLGTPGGGKTMLTSKLCRDLSRNAEGIAGRAYTPVPVFVGEYMADKGAQWSSITQYVAKWINAHFQQTPPRDAIEHLLQQGRLLVIFDGLDEVVDVRRRRDLRTDIEWFCKNYPDAPVLVTSREVGYGNAPLSREIFTTYQLLPFTDEQIKEYAIKWFELDQNPLLTLDQKHQRAFRFLAAVANTDLKTVPLLLALMCIIFKDENQLPLKQLHLYKKCADMLGHIWENRKKLIPARSTADSRSRSFLDTHLNSTIQYLAHWIYTEAGPGYTINEEQVGKVITQYLRERKYSGDASGVVTYFLEMCSTREWVFTRVSAPGAPQALYRFTHLSFLEYFTALHLTRRHRHPQDLAQVLHPHIAADEWHRVAQLAYQDRDENGDENFVNDLLHALLLDVANERPERRVRLLSFAASSLELLSTADPDTIDAVVEASARDWLEAWGPGAATGEPGAAARIGQGHRELFCGLLCLPEPTRETVANCLERYLLQQVATGAPETAVRALEVGLHLVAPLADQKSERVDDARLFWYQRSRRILDKAAAHVERLGEVSIGVCVDAYWNGKIPLSVLIARHGLRSLFSDVRYRMFPWRTFQAPAKWVIMDAAESDPAAPNAEHRYAMAMAKLREVAHEFPRQPLPWVTEMPAGSRSFLMILQELESLGREMLADSQELTADERFGLFLLSATLMEVSPEGECERLKQMLRYTRVPLFDLDRWFLLARFETETWPAGTLERLIDACAFDATQAKMVQEWVAGRVSFVALPDECLLPQAD